MKTEGVIFEGTKKVGYGEIETPDPGHHDVVVRTTHSWISNGTEGSFLRGERIDGVQPWDGKPPGPFPMVPGYQKVGVVEWVGPEVKSVKKGQTVFATITMTKGTHLGFGGHLLSGPSNENEVIPIPDTPDPIAYSGLVLTQVGWNCGWRTPGDGAYSVVVGDGMVGLWAAQTLKARGSHVALMGKHDERMKLYKPADGDLVLRGDGDDWAEKLKDWAGGELDTIVDTVGYHVNKKQNDALQQMLRWSGHFVETGHVGDHNLLDIRPLVMKETTLHLPCGWTREKLETTRDWIHDGRLETLPLITHRLPAKEAAHAWDLILNKKEGALGVVLEWPT